jgi:hypothetical protein
MSKKLLYLMSFVLVLAMTGTASADQWDITVPDAGFDEHVLDNPGDWIYIGDEAYTGAWQSLFAENGAWIDYNYYASDGDLPALSGNLKAYGTYTADDYIYQILDETFIEGGTYTLSVWVGIAWSGYDDYWSLYFTGEDHANNLSETSGSAQVGSWGQVSLVYTATAADAGQRIGIKMKGAEYVTFEDVTLLYDAPPLIPIVNAGFEDPVLDEDGWTWLDVPGWTWVGGEGPGIWHVTSTDFDPVVAPEGQNVLYTENAVGDAGGVAQVLTDTFAANMEYTLTVEVGNSYYYYNGGYSVQLLAGGVVIAEDNDTLWPEYYKWATSTVEYTYNPADAALVGQPLEIRLLNLALDKDNPPAGEVVGVEFDNVTLSYVAGAEPGVTIPVDPDSDLAAANALAMPGDTIEFAEGTYILTSQIEIKDGVTYQGAGAGLTIIDGNNVTRAFVAWGDRGATNGQVDVNGVSVPNATGPTGWVLEGMTIQNCVADNEDRQDILSAARDLLNNYTGTPYTLATAQAENGGITDNPGWFDILSGSADDDLTDVELQTYLDGNPVGSAGHLVVNGDQNGDGGAITIHNAAIGTIQNCDFLNNHTPAEGDGDDGGAINITGLSVVTINDCLFNGNYAVSPDSVAVDGFSGHGGHIVLQGGSASAITPGTTLIANRCVFLNGNAEDDGGAIRTGAVGSIVRLDACWFEGNTSWDNGNVLMIGNESSGELTVTNCIFANNITKADNSPDRMCQVRRNSKFINCTFVGNNQEDQDLIYNNAAAADTDADGTDDEMADATQVINCIFANNVVGNGDDVLGSRNNDFTIAATNCLFFGNTLQNGNAADNTQRPDVETGSITDDPLLDVLYIPGAGSPAIDAGVDPTSVGVTLTTDYNGDARPQGAAYDIGAYEIAAAPIEPGLLIVPKTSVAPIIDGQWDAVWNDVDETRCLITDMINTDSAPPRT